MVRTLLAWRILGEDLVGTCHVPTPGRAGGLSGAPAVGVLLLNAGSAPRSGNSDLSVQLGDRLALRGFPVYRFDFCGLGDSSGPTPRDLDAYWNEVLLGRNDAATLALIARVRVECGVARVVVGGLCAAALPSVRALAEGETSTAGLLLLEPNFRLSAGNLPLQARPRSRLARAAGRLWRGLAPLQAGLGPAFLRRFLARSWPRWPRDANRALATAWLASLERGVPSLVVVAAGGGTEHYLARLLRGRAELDAAGLTRVRVSDTNHLFSAGPGRAALLEACERWMLAHFGGLETGLGREFAARPARVSEGG